MYLRNTDAVKTCQECNCVLTDKNWTKSQQGYHRYICMPCYAARQKRYASKLTPEQKIEARKKYNETRRNWSPQKKEEQRRKAYNHTLKKLYGITIEDYDKMLADQNGRCDICFTANPRGNGVFHLDHCHETKKVRGILCTECNMMLGMAKDKTEVLLSAINYLNKHSHRKDHTHEARKQAGGKQF